MQIQLTHRLVEAFPKLGWTALLHRDTGHLELRHGTKVEICPFGLVDGVWDGPFEEWGFHRSEHFFGSGVRVDGGSVYLVPSCAHVDRILYVEMGDLLYAANSLPLLLAAIDATLDPELSYIRESHAIAAGIHEYARTIPVLHPVVSSVNQLFHESAVVTGTNTRTEIRTTIKTFIDFDDYFTALRHTLSLIGANLNSSSRLHALDQVCTISSGYDSPAVAVLAREVGLSNAYTSRISNSNVPSWISRAAAIDDGRPIAEALGLTVGYLLQPAGNVGNEEGYFSASGTSSPELIFHSLFREIHSRDTPSILFSGYYGDIIWGLSTDQSMRDGSLRMPVLDGLALSEARLWAGIIHVPVPYIHARSIGSVFEISHSAEMMPWRLGGSYDRPIPRRIIEQAGVGRKLFGIRKKAVLQHYRIPLNPTLRSDFFCFLLDRGVSVFKVRRQAVVDRLLSSFRSSGDEQTLLLHHWSVERLRTRFRDAMNEADVVEDSVTIGSGRECEPF